MRILCVIDYLGSGGAQRQLVNLAIGFKERGHNVSFLVYYKHNFYENVLNEHGIVVNEIVEKNYILRVLKIRKFIRRGNYDSILSFLEAANFICEFSGLPSKKWRLVVGERSSNPQILKSPKLIFYRWFHFFSNFVVSNSHSNIKIIKRINPLLPEKKLKVIYNLIDYSKWKPDKEYKPRPKGKLNLVITASHRYLKNLDGLVEAVYLLSNEEKNQIRIKWYGEIQDDSLNNATQKIAIYNLTDIFLFHPASSLIHEEVKKADVVGLFSFFEGLPNTICEAMAVGKTVISSNVSDIPNLILDQNMVFNPHKPQEIANAISRVINLDNQRLTEIGESNRMRIKEIINNEQIINSYLKLLTGESFN